MNKLKYVALLGIVALGFSSCLKDKPFLDVSNTQPIIEFSQGSDGTSSASWGSFDSTVVDTAIAIDIASPQVLDYDVTVKIAYDQSLIAKWNAANPDNTVQLLPDSTGVIPASPITVKIPAGFRIGKIPIKLLAGKIDPTVSYAMPFTITSATGPNGQNLIVSSNSGAMFYAFIGNPIAGPYTQEYIRYNTATQTPPALVDATSPGLFVPVTPVKISAESGTGVIYLLSFTNTGGVLSDFKLTIDAASVTAAGITISDGPTIITADPIAGKYEFNYQYLNSANAARNITDIFTK